MTPEINSIIESTFQLQQTTNRLQLFTLALILVCDVFIVLSILNIRKATRINKEWSERLRAASAIEARRAETQGGSVADESAGPQDDAPVQP